MEEEESLDNKTKHKMLITEREELFAHLQNIKDVSSKITAENVRTFLPKYERLPKIEERLEKLCGKIRSFNAVCDDKKLLIETSQTYLSFIDLIDTVRANYLKITNVHYASPNPELNSEPSSSVSSQLPRINLTTFSGKIEEWSSYFALFESLVHLDVNLSPVKKFQYLRSSLRGDALAVVASFPLTGPSYTLALDALKARYANKRRLASHFITNILDFNPIREQSLPELQRYLNVHQSNFDSLATLNLVDILDFVKLQIALSHLDPVTRRDFEDRHSKENFPTYDQLIEYVTERLRREELISSENRNNKNSSSNKINSRDQFKGNSPISKNISKSSKTVELYNLNVSDKTPSSDTVTFQTAASKSSHSGGRSNQISQTAALTSIDTPLICWNCDGQHVFSSCTLPRKKFCYKCGYKEVNVNTCPNCSKRSKNAQGNQ